MVMTITEMRELKEQKGDTLEEIAEKSGIDIELAAKIFYKKSRSGKRNSMPSPSTRKKDFGKKLEKYVDAGVREYWIADVKNQKVIVYDLGDDFGENMDLMIYGMDGEVPVGIYDGECKIDFEEIVNSVVNI